MSWNYSETHSSRARVPSVDVLQKYDSHHRRHLRKKIKRYQVYLSIGHYFTQILRQKIPPKLVKLQNIKVVFIFVKAYKETNKICIYWLGGKVLFYFILDLKKNRIPFLQFNNYILTKGKFWCWLVYQIFMYFLVIISASAFLLLCLRLSSNSAMLAS